MRPLRVALPLAAAALAWLGARQLGQLANDERGRWPKDATRPFAPSPGAAPFVSLGYRELGADLFYVRARGYFGGDDYSPPGLTALVDAIVALDPRFQRIYEWGGRTISFTEKGARQADHLAALRILERGMQEFPDLWVLPFLAGQIYTIDLKSSDPAQQRAWQEEGARLLEMAVRKPGAPRDAATLAAHLRTKLGQRERAIRDLRELILTTDDPKVREKLTDKLAQITEADRDALGDELAQERERFEHRWKAERPEVAASLYLLLGDRPRPYFDLGDLAVDRDLIGAEATDDDALLDAPQTE